MFQIISEFGTKLEYLSLEVKLSADAMKHITNLTSLKFFEISSLSTCLSPDDFIAMADNFENLETLHLRFGLNHSLHMFHHNNNANQGMKLKRKGKGMSFFRQLIVPIFNETIWLKNLGLFQNWWPQP